MEDMKNTIAKLAVVKKGNFFTRYWNGLSKKRKFGIFVGLIFILSALLLIGTGFLNSKPPQVSTIPSSQMPLVFPAQSTNTSGIEVRIITNTSWIGTAEVYYRNGTSEDIVKYLAINGTGNKIFTVNGTPSSIWVHVEKQNNDPNELIVEIVVNGTIVKSETLNTTFRGPKSLSHGFSM